MNGEREEPTGSISLFHRITLSFFSLSKRQYIRWLPHWSCVFSSILCHVTSCLTNYAVTCVTGPPYPVTLADIVITSPSNPPHTQGEVIYFRKKNHW